MRPYIRLVLLLVHQRGVQTFPLILRHLYMRSLLFRKFRLLQRMSYFQLEPREFSEDCFLQNAEDGQLIRDDTEAEGLQGMEDDGN